MVDQQLLSALSNYGFAALAALGLGWAIIQLYRSHQGERQTWLESMQRNFDRLVHEMEANRAEMREMASLIQHWIAEHHTVSADARDLIDRLKRHMEEHGR